MKKSLLFGLSLSLAFASNAQTTVQGQTLPTVPASANQAKVFNKKMISGNETNADGKPANERPANPVTGVGLQRSTNEVTVGYTTYDLQSNSATQDRIINHGDGNLSVVWTRSTTGDLGASDRGTGYNYFNVADIVAGVTPTLPTQRLESSRTGWPNIDKLASGEEVSIAHNTAISQLTMMKNTAQGSPSWTQTDLNTGDQVWNRMAVGGYDGNSIHHISLRAPSGLGGAVYEGVDGALLYYRSLDGGVTWDINGEFIPGLDSSNYRSMSGDSYSIEVRDSIVALCYWGDIAPTMFAKSTDNGDTWVVRKIIDHGIKYDAGSNNTNAALDNGWIGISDVNGDGIADTLAASDGAGAIEIDANGTVHITYGTMRYLDDAAGDDSWSYFPVTNGLMYWNENMGENEPVLIGAALDLDGDGILGGVSLSGAEYTGGEYFMSFSAMPNMANGDDGCLYVAFSAYMENADNGIQNYRHIYVTRSCDGGCTWTTQIDVTPLTSTSGVGECVFPSIAQTDTSLHLVYQFDWEPGLAVRGDEDPFGDNYIKYTNVSVADLDTTIELCYSYIQDPVYTTGCDGDSILIETSCGTAYSWSTGGSSSAEYGYFPTAVAGFDTVSVTITTACGFDEVHKIGLTNASSISATPNFDLFASAMEICDGDTMYISATSVSNGAYSWNTGHTTQVIAVDSAMTYVVTVSNCGGAAADSITIASPNVPVAMISGATEFCDGDSTMLVAALEPSATYDWNTGDTTRVIYTDSLSTYSVTVSNCSGSHDTSFTIASFIADPVPVFTVSANNFCEGTNTATCSASGGDSYEWSTGSNNSFIQVNSAGTTTVNVTATNVCGVSVAATAVTVTIYTLPSAPTLTTSTSGSNYVITSDATTNNWYLNGTLDAGVTGDTYTDTWQNLEGDQVSAVAVDGNGCESTATAVTPVATGIETIVASEVKLYPNPNNGVFTISAENGNYTVRIQNMLGQTIYNGRMNTAAQTFDLSNVDKGVYFVSISNENFETTEKVIVK